MGSSIEPAGPISIIKLGPAAEAGQPEVILITPTPMNKGDIGREDVREDVANPDNIIKTRGLPMFGAPGVSESLVDLYFEG